MRNARNLVLCVALFGACGERALEPIDVGPGCPEPLPDVPWRSPQLLVDDLEDGDRWSRREGGLDGDWEFWTDETNPGAMFEVSSRCSGRGRFAAHASSPGQNGWGAAANLFFRRPHPSPWDGSAYDVLVVHVALGAGQAPRRMRVSLSTMDTAWNGRCTMCLDNFAAQVDVGPRWARYDIPIASLAVAGWGRPAPTRFARDELVQVHFAFEGAFDVWIDDVGFDAGR